MKSFADDIAATGEALIENYGPVENDKEPAEPNEASLKGTELAERMAETDDPVLASLREER